MFCGRGLKFSLVAHRNTISNIDVASVYTSRAGWGGAGLGDP